MSLLQIKFTKSGVTGIKRRDLQSVGRNAILVAGKYWLNNYARLHFMNTAMWRYNYNPRTSAYRKSKRGRVVGKDGVRATGEDLPLVFTGRTRASVLRYSHVEATAQNYRTYKASVIMPAPALNFWEWLREELERIIPQELNTLSKVFGKEYERQLVMRGKTLKATKTYRAAA